MINKIKKNLSKNMLLYTLIAIVLGILLGYVFNMKSLSNLTIPIVFVMIYPMMVNLSLSSLKKIKESKKPLIQAIILNFVFAPALMYLLTTLFATSPQMKLAMMLLSIAPASSMGLGYIGLGEGHMISGAIIVAVAFILSIFVYPLVGRYLIAGTSLSVPTSLILQNLLVILVIPLILGIITREYIERKHGAEKFLNIKPYFSSLTLIALYLLIFVIFAAKSKLILNNLVDIWLLLPIALLFYGTTIFLVLLFNKHVFKFEYGHHQSVVFTTVSKNIALTIAILVSVFGKEGQYMAVFPAIVVLFQAPLLMVYLKFSKKIKKWFEK